LHLAFKTILQMNL